ncbi:MAG: hypothetical protein QM778_27920 [Myxococcales bacterium]
MTPKEFIAARNSAVCEYVARCSDQIHAVGPSSVGIGLADGCADYIDEDDELQTLVARGHTKIEPKAAERCLAAISSCESDVICGLALVGTLAQGASCASHQECSSRNCEGGSRASCGQCGAAPAPAKLGGPCVESVGCEQSGEAFVACLRGKDLQSVCVVARTVTVGESCAVAGHVCEEDAYCHPDGTCRLPVAAGQPCNDTDRCVRGALCTGAGAGAGAGAGRTCVAVTLRTEGETCVTDGEFSIADDGTFHVCDVTKDLRCDEATRTCAAVERVGNGQSCNGQQRCEPGLFCNERFLCTPPLSAGESCRATPECESRRCEGGVCVPVEVPVCTN